MNLSRALCSQTVQQDNVADGLLRTDRSMSVCIHTSTSYLSIDKSFPPRTGLSIFASDGLKNLEKDVWATTGDRWVDV